VLIETAGETTDGVRKGSVRIRTSSDSTGTHFIRFEDVLHVPSLQVNLISHSVLKKKGVVYDPYHKDLQNLQIRKPFADVSMVSGLYKVAASTAMPSPDTARAFHVDAKAIDPVIIDGTIDRSTKRMPKAHASVDVMHRRLAHASIQTLRHLYDIKGDLNTCSGC
jgi:hypothetical protein